MATQKKHCYTERIFVALGLGWDLAHHHCHLLNESLPYSKENRREEAGHTGELVLGTSGPKTPAERPYGRAFLLPPHFLSGSPSVGHRHSREEIQFQESVMKAEMCFLGPKGIRRNKREAMQSGPGRHVRRGHEAVCSRAAPVSHAPRPPPPPCTDRGPSWPLGAPACFEGLHGASLS